MDSVARLRRDYRDAGPLHAQLKRSEGCVEDVSPHPTTLRSISLYS